MARHKLVWMGFFRDVAVIDNTNRINAFASVHSAPNISWHGYRQMELDGGMFLVTYLTGVVKSWMYWPILG